MSLDYLIIGAGPAGLSCAVEAHKKGSEYLVIDKGCIVNSIFNFPADMLFFSTPELLTIGELVFVTQNFRPTRMEVLKYYLAVAEHYDLDINTFENVDEINKNGQGFKVKTSKQSGGENAYEAKNVVVATGYYDWPNMLGIEGEDLPKVSHYYGEAHAYHGKDVAIIGAKNSAVEAAITFQRSGAKVTIIHRGEGISDSVKYWVRPDIEKRLETGDIKALFDSEVVKIHPDHLDIKNNITGEVTELENDFLFALTGYRPDEKLLKGCGVTVDSKTIAPEHNPDTMETNVPGLYVAGSIASGVNNNKIFIENSREHGKVIVG
ncbi:Thioredoxin reductase [hydrothermal vent metagenome]|uniref:Thioredoxin reductase n=1 Tax=hydrothermal vent metagenome TaxID=652676 RepID=A0A3B1CJK8_9ZZZZ